jgi:hypothetical protein
MPSWCSQLDRRALLAMTTGGRNRLLHPEQVECIGAVIRTRDQGQGCTLEIGPLTDYDRTMDATKDPLPPGTLESLARSKAQIEAGQTVPMESFLSRLRASIARMEARQAERAKRAVRKA